MIKESGRIFDKKSPADAEAVEALLNQLESEEVQESIAHLQHTINNIEEALNVIKQRDFDDMSEEELDEVAEVIENLDKFKIEMNMLVDDYLGQGALIHANLPEGMMAEPPKEFLGWGARKLGDPDFAFAPPTIPLAEASKDNNMLKELIKIANELDKRGLCREADYLDKILKYSASMLEATLESLSQTNKLKMGSDKWVTQSAQLTTRIKNFVPSLQPSEIKILRDAIYASKGPGLSTFMRSDLLGKAKNAAGASKWAAAKALQETAEVAVRETAEVAAREGAEVAARGGAGVAGKTLAKKIVGRVLLPVGVAMDVYAIGVAGVELYGAFEEIGEAERRISLNTVKSAIRMPIAISLGERRKAGEDVTDDSEAVRLWNLGQASSDANMKRAFIRAISYVRPALWSDHSIDTYIHKAKRSAAGKYVDEDAIEELYEAKMAGIILG